MAPSFGNVVPWWCQPLAPATRTADLVHILARRRHGQLLWHLSTKFRRKALEITKPSKALGWLPTGFSVSYIFIHFHTKPHLHRSPLGHWPSTRAGEPNLVQLNEFCFLRLKCLWRLWRMGPRVFYEASKRRRICVQRQVCFARTCSCRTSHTSRSVMPPTKRAMSVPSQGTK